MTNSACFLLHLNSKDIETGIIEIYLNCLPLVVDVEMISSPQLCNTDWENEIVVYAKIRRLKGVEDDYLHSLKLSFQKEE